MPAADGALRQPASDPGVGAAVQTSAVGKNGSLGGKAVLRP
jgi:hypothetical protein